jgi:choline kinase
MLDSRAPPGTSYQEQEAQAERNTEEEARRLMAETKLWRIANSAMWVAWGIVQAHVPGLPADGDAAKDSTAAPAVAVEAAAETSSQAPTDPAVGTETQQSGSATKPELPLDADADLFKAQDDEEFDYLAYSQDRAMFVWGDLVGMGLVKKEELPEALVARMKVVEY